MKSKCHLLTAALLLTVPLTQAQTNNPGTTIRTPTEPSAPAESAPPPEHSFKASLDPVLNWKNPFALTPEKLEAAYKTEGFKTSPFYAWSQHKTEARLARRPYTNVAVDLTMMNGAAAVEEAVIHFASGAVTALEIELSDTPPDTVTDALSQTIGSAPQLRTAGAATFATWPLADSVIIFSHGGKATELATSTTGMKFQRLTQRTAARIQIVRPALAHRSLIHDLGDRFALVCDLDFLLDLPSAWQLTQAALDARFDASAHGLKEQPFFQWLTSGKDGARFSRAPFSNITVDLRLFGGKVSVDEAVVDFKNGKPSLVTFSIYNRGDSGLMGPTEFEALYRSVGSATGKALNIAPQLQRPGMNQAVRMVSWQWQSPTAIAQMDYNDYSGKGAKAALPEFLRLKLAPAGNKDWNFGASPTGLLTKSIGRADLLKSVTKGEGGDVFIKGVPMVDQGDKGYCVVASCQRLFEFYQIACDQHELAQLAGSDAQQGTRSDIMEEVLGKIDSRFKTRFKMLLSPSLRADDKYKPSLVKFHAMIKDNISQGIPLLWSLELGLVPEDPPLRGLQTTGGHMRMIIGYNEAKGQVLFSDSWGAGHELKRISAADAFSVTRGLYVMYPRG